MGRKGLPDLPETGRHYVENTLRARLASPGLERYPAAKSGSGGRVALVALGIVALFAALVWLWR